MDKLLVLQFHFNKKALNGIAEHLKDLSHIAYKGKGKLGQLNHH